MGMLDHMDVINFKSNCNMIVYGDAGVGKTLGMSIAPKPLIVNFEGGLLSLNILQESGYAELLDIKSITPNSIKELNELFMELKDTEHDRQTVIIDSLTELQKMSMDEILANPKRDNSKLDENTPTLQEYGKNTNQLRKLVRLFRDLDMNVIFTCLAKENKDETDGKIKVMPNLTDKLAYDVMGYVDIVAYMFVDDSSGERKLLTQPKGKYIAKDRTNKLGIGLKNPTAYEILIKAFGYERPEQLDEIVKTISKRND